MSFLRKIFGTSDPVEPLRRAKSRMAWADILARAEQIDPARLDAAAREELDSLVCEAGDALAEINLAEMEACLRAGDSVRAAEHLALAADQARSEGLRRRVSESRTSPRPAAAVTAAPAVAPAAAGCGAGCGSGGHGAPLEGHDDDLDDETRLELILSGYPPAWRERYLAMGSAFRAAFFLSHEGREREALRAFEAVPDQERDAVFHFERGTLLSRTGDHKKGVRDLQEAISRDPEHLLAHKALIDLELSLGQSDSAESRLRALLAHPEAEEFCHGRLCAVEARRNNIEKAIEHGLRAASGGDPQVLVMTASLLEKTGRLAEAEALLTRLPAGGCKGGPSLPLAEFWVRHSLNPDKALGAFKGALRQEPENPRWLLRIAQIYSQKGWKKEALPLLEGIVSRGGMEPEMHQEAHRLLIACRTNGNA